MNAIGSSSVVFVTLSGLFWGGWVVGSQTPEGQEALAKAYEAYAQQQAAASEDLFAPTALRAVVCGAVAHVLGYARMWSTLTMVLLIGSALSMGLPRAPAR